MKTCTFTGVVTDGAVQALKAADTSAEGLVTA
jgi:hypothetical protein